MNGPESARNDADAAQTYMVEIARFTPLSRSEENRLGDRLRAGDPLAHKRLIEAKGLRKLRHSTRGSRLFAHYEVSHDLDG